MEEAIRAKDLEILAVCDEMGIPFPDRLPAIPGSTYLDHDPILDRDAQQCTREIRISCPNHVSTAGTKCRIRVVSIAHNGVETVVSPGPIIDPDTKPVRLVGASRVQVSLPAPKAQLVHRSHPNITSTLEFTRVSGSYERERVWDICASAPGSDDREDGHGIVYPDYWEADVQFPLSGLYSIRVSSSGQMVSHPIECKVHYFHTDSLADGHCMLRIPRGHLSTKSTKGSGNPFLANNTMSASLSSAKLRHLGIKSSSTPSTPIGTIPAPPSGDPMVLTDVDLATESHYIVCRGKEEREREVVRERERKHRKAMIASGYPEDSLPPLVDRSTDPVGDKAMLMCCSPASTRLGSTAAGVYIVRFKIHGKGSPDTQAKQHGQPLGVSLGVAGRGFSTAKTSVEQRCMYLYGGHPMRSITRRKSRVQRYSCSSAQSVSTSVSKGQSKLARSTLVNPSGLPVRPIASTGILEVNETQCGMARIGLSDIVSEFYGPPIHFGDEVAVVIRVHRAMGEAEMQSSLAETGRGTSQSNRKKGQVCTKPLADIGFCIKPSSLSVTGEGEREWGMLGVEAESEGESDLGKWLGWAFKGVEATYVVVETLTDDSVIEVL
ncbi:hypothetical protein KIPB_006023 [Kipferlia bialata]|uniref:Uncharacterized protein n=1 Tax=Kipferlia bialata TaxID=797122 RepID=A0A9K3CY89_9EUKA|nr:hypothetical protein KIPB_006023 [Kipferlia bialata]|eukprot:g6023.t1